jgi:hypothetical protein
MHTTVRELEALLREYHMAMLEDEALTGPLQMRLAAMLTGCPLLAVALVGWLEDEYLRSHQPDKF